MSFNPTPRRTHRKRVSALRLSSDTTSTLPEYLPTGFSRDHIVHSDQPPDYPDSAEEADEDTDPDLDLVEVPQPVFQKLSPKRPKRFLPSHKRRHSSQHQSSDPHLDSLLERSVHALEMSNTLLQSSLSTQTSLSAVLALDSPPEFTLEARAHNLSSKIRNNADVQQSWADDLQEITRNLEGLCREGTGHSRQNRVRAIHPEDGAISCSLPSSGLRTMRKHLRRPSLDLRQASADTAANLHYSPHSRCHLIAPPPRALTQYVASTQDSESILLPSTLGHRSSSSLHHASDWKTLSERASSSTINLLSTPSLPPKLTDKPLEPSTPAYTMLSSFVHRAPSSGSATPSSSFTSSFMSRRRDSSNGSTSTERGHGCTRRSSSPASLKSLDKSHHHCNRTCSVCASGVPGCLLAEPSKRVVSSIRPMTPPVEEPSSSSDSCVAKRTVQSLRKILDDQTALQPNGQDNGSLYRSRLRAPPFLPRSPAPVAEAGTSTATASISRLLTKGTHSSSTRAPSPPRQSAMKRSPSSSTSLNSVTPTPPNATFNTPLTLSFPEVVVKVLGGGSTPSSGMSTPSKRISFAELPESYASTRPNDGSSSKFKDKHSRRKRKNTKLGGGRGRQEQSSPERTGWWNGWLTTGGANVHGFSMTLARQEERMEERTGRNWGGRMGAGFSSNLDDWAV